MELSLIELNLAYSTLSLVLNYQTIRELWHQSPIFLKKENTVRSLAKHHAGFVCQSATYSLLVTMSDNHKPLYTHTFNPANFRLGLNMLVMMFIGMLKEVRLQASAEVGHTSTHHDSSPVLSGLWSWCSQIVAQSQTACNSNWPHGCSIDLVVWQLLLLTHIHSGYYYALCIALIR